MGLEDRLGRIGGRLWNQEMKAHRAISWVIFEVFLQFRQARGKDFQLGSSGDFVGNF